MTALILNWRQAYEAGVLTCGGKGYHLAKLHRYGFPVPDGGVVVADVYRQLIHAPALAGSLRGDQHPARRRRHGARGSGGTGALAAGYYRRGPADAGVY